MIVHPIPHGWQMIDQRAHALLASQIATAWHPDARPAAANARWIETVIAISRHDDGGHGFGGHNHIGDAGTPLDLAGAPLSLDQPVRVMEEARGAGLWTGVLISMHVLRLYSAFRAEPGFAQFLDEQTERQKAWLRQLNVKKADADAAYGLLHFCDSLSLILCRRDLPTDGRAIEIATLPDGTRYDVRQVVGKKGGDPRATDSDAPTPITVEPSPFGKGIMPLYVEAAELPSLTFKDDADLDAQLDTCPRATLRWDLQG